MAGGSLRRDAGSKETAEAALMVAKAGAGFKSRRRLADHRRTAH